MKNKEYSLSARLRQTFDFLAMKVYSVVYKQDDKFHFNPSLNKVGIVLMQNIADFCQSKLEQHLNMLSLNPVKAASERDQDIRFDRAFGEQPDNTESYMAD